MANHNPNQNQLSWLIPVSRYRHELNPISGISEKFLRKVTMQSMILTRIKKKIEARNSPSLGSFQSIKLWKKSG